MSKPGPRSATEAESITNRLFTYKFLATMDYLVFSASASDAEAQPAISVGESAVAPKSRSARNASQMAQTISDAPRLASGLDEAVTTALNRFAELSLAGTYDLSPKCEQYASRNLSHIRAPVQHAKMLDPSEPGTLTPATLDPATVAFSTRFNSQLSSMSHSRSDSEDLQYPVITETVGQLSRVEAALLTSSSTSTTPGSKAAALTSPGTTSTGPGRNLRSGDRGSPSELVTKQPNSPPGLHLESLSPRAVEGDVLRPAGWAPLGVSSAAGQGAAQPGSASRAGWPAPAPAAEPTTTTTKPSTGLLSVDGFSGDVSNSSSPYGVASASPAQPGAAFNGQPSSQPLAGASGGSTASTSSINFSHLVSAAQPYVPVGLIQDMIGADASELAWHNLGGSTGGGDQQPQPAYFDGRGSAPPAQGGYGQNQQQQAHRDEMGYAGYDAMAGNQFKRPASSSVPQFDQRQAVEQYPHQGPPQFQQQQQMRPYGAAPTPPLPPSTYAPGRSTAYPVIPTAGGVGAIAQPPQPVPAAPPAPAAAAPPAGSWNGPYNSNNQQQQMPPQAYGNSSGGNLSSYAQPFESGPVESAMPAPAAPSPGFSFERSYGHPQRRNAPQQQQQYQQMPPPQQQAPMPYPPQQQYQQQQQQPPRAYGGAELQGQGQAWQPPLPPMQQQQQQQQYRGGYPAQPPMPQQHQQAPYPGPHAQQQQGNGYGYQQQQQMPPPLPPMPPASHPQQQHMQHMHAPMPQNQMMMQPPLPGYGPPPPHQHQPHHGGGGGMYGNPMAPPHMMPQPPMQHMRQQQRGGGGASRKVDMCAECGSTGHTIRYCPVVRCYKCLGTGHMQGECPYNGPY